MHRAGSQRSGYPSNGTCLTASATASTRKGCATAGNFSHGSCGPDALRSRRIERAARAAGPLSEKRRRPSAAVMRFRRGLVTHGAAFTILSRYPIDCGAHRGSQGKEARSAVNLSPAGFPALVLNADFRPLSYYPLSLWSWQDAIKAVFLERVNIVAQYDRAVRSPSLEMKLPSVVSLKTFVKPATQPAFTRFNVFLRDKFSCQYCGSREDLTFDHLLPRSRGGHTTWIN